MGEGSQNSELNKLRRTEKNEEFRMQNAELKLFLSMGFSLRSV
jgi:hypothetical protein